MDERFLVSVITPMYNSGACIGKTIESVLFQTYLNWEMIVVNDCSNDNSLDVVCGYAKMDDRILVINNDLPSGAAVSRNVAISEAKGRFIAFLDSDDIWYPSKLEEQLSFMISNSYEFTYTAYDKFVESGEIVGHIDVPSSVSYFDLLKTCSIGCLTVMYDTEKIGKVYMPIIEKRQDYALWLRILKIVPRAYGINRSLAKYRLSPNSISSNKLNASKFQWRVYREIEGFSLIRSAYYFANYFFYGVIKTYFK